MFFAASKSRSWVAPQAQVHTRSFSVSASLTLPHELFLDGLQAVVLDPSELGKRKTEKQKAKAPPQKHCTTHRMPKRKAKKKTTALNCGGLVFMEQHPKRYGMHPITMVFCPKFLPH
jgi:hypothetical protein